MKVLIGAAYSWFVIDISFYGLGPNSSVILTTINFGGSKATGGQGIYESLFNVSVGNCILAAAGLIPGYWATFFFIDSWGRKKIQLIGFAVLTVIFAVTGFSYHTLQATDPGRSVFVFLYCLANFFQNFGPNVTVFIVPGGVFPTRYRSPGHGIATASGRFGAVVAQVGFARLSDIGGKDRLLKHILEIFALFMATGVFSTMLVPDTKRRTLEELSNEDQMGFIRTRRVVATDGAGDEVGVGRARRAREFRSW